MATQRKQDRCIVYLRPFITLCTVDNLINGCNNTYMRPSDVYTRFANYSIVCLGQLLPPYTSCSIFDLIIVCSYVEVHIGNCIIN